MIERVPGDASALYEAFIGPPGDGIDFIGRYGRLADDLVAALHLAGESFDEQALRAHPPVNVSDYVRLPACYGRRAAERLAECERAAIERFYPEDPLPVQLLHERDRAPARPRPVTVRNPWHRTPARAQRA